MPLSPARVLRQFRYALFFDGVDDFVVVRHNPVLDVQPGNMITVVMIANFLGFRPGLTIGVPIDKRTEAYANYNWEYSSTAMFMRIHAGGLIRGVSVPHSLRVWNHYTMVLNGSWLGGYLDGVLRASRNDVPTTQGNTVDLYIGSTILKTFYTVGYIAQILIYTRPLADPEIKHNYINPDNPVRNGLVLWLRAHPDYVKDIDGDGVPEWLDLSGFNNHGKIYGATLVKLIRDPVR